ncbi:O-methyltransferase [Aspergillus ibericus CBS 121593]|uniref:O-methyltransferase n=1 Tax=Aspergillus ibericus CBS 121593 TaxID=1448316 RepID=A0A395GPJ0_9EURO|nr:O-methyltransferase [Aspergillus ibericus CBS 121593]RAK95943.1 O-methyltransferase [Aspergillus ibericus CBS 121593]
MSAPQNIPIPDAGKRVLSTVTLAPALGFVPIAVHFDLFGCLHDVGKPATAQDVCNVHRRKYGESDLSVPLANDALFLMGGLGFLDLLPDDVYLANEVTKFLVETPSAQHGAMHFTSEGLLGAAFLMRHLQDTKFQYPFQECDTPFQYAYKCMGNDFLAQEHVYSVMHHTGRLDSFNTFMTGKFGRWGTMPDRVRKLGYDLDGLLQSVTPDHLRIVDIGGGRGELLLELKAAYPHLLHKDHLILQEYNADIGVVPEVTEMEWNYKENGSEQPVQGALLYSMAHVLHNLSDIESIKLLAKVARVMAPGSRLLIQELTKNAASATTHAAMIVMHAGRERTSAEWQDLAAFAGLEVTFEAYPPLGECVVEMRKVLN